jgi:adenosylcobinamide kinase/adenosylcobinamide-phosphate guanylyltransferase
VLLALPDECSTADATSAVLGEIDALLSFQQSTAATWIVVTNEVGMGVVPPYRLGRLYRDALGAANQKLAQAADEVLLLVAGLPWRLR